MHRTASMLVRDIATSTVVTVERDTTLAACAEHMRARHVGSVVVVDRTGRQERPVGLVTDRDIVVEAVAQSVDPTRLTAADVMVAPLATIAADDDLVDALARMREQGVRRLAVVDADQSLVGIVALDDVVAALAQQFVAVAEVVAASRTKEAVTRPAG
jgi:CBS domain-containing protein